MSEIFYRAVNPGQIAESLEEYQVERSTFFARVKQFELVHFNGEHKLQVVSNHAGMFANHIVNGQSLPASKIPAGWHKYSKDGEVRPYVSGRNAASKAAVKALEELNATSPGHLRNWLSERFGVQEGGFLTFGFEQVGDDFYVLTSKKNLVRSQWEDDDFEGNEHFKRVKASEYWMAKEAEEEREGEADA